MFELNKTREQGLAVQAYTEKSYHPIVVDA